MASTEEIYEGEAWKDVDSPRYKMKKSFQKFNISNSPIDLLIYHLYVLFSCYLFAYHNFS